jgi:hypothetical protein
MLPNVKCVGCRTTRYIVAKKVLLNTSISSQRDWALGFETGENGLAKKQESVEVWK